MVKILDLKTDNADALIKKVAHSKTILENVCFNVNGTPDALVSRTHIIIVYDGKNTEASSLVVRDLLPQKKSTNPSASRHNFKENRPEKKLIS